MFAAAATAALLSLSGPSSPASQQTQPPTFKSGIDLLTLQASVIDKSGRPIADLTASDFAVTVEGKPRKVLFARFRGTTDAVTASPTPAGPAGAPAAHADNARTAGGRLVMFVVDRDSIRKGSEKALLESSTAILDALTPADAAGVLSIPASGVDPTRDHARVRDELKRVAGTQPAPIGGVLDRNITWDEALDFERGDKTTMARVIERECRPSSNPDRPSNCPQEIETQARTLLAAGRGHARTILQALENTLKALTPVRGPKYVVLISGGQAFDQELLVHYNDFARAAAASRITLHAVHVDQPESDVADRRTVSSGFGGRDMGTGLTTMTGMTGGAYYAGVGRAAGVFDRIKTEIANDYELGIETLPTDADGKLRDVSVKVNRPDVSVRTRRQVLLEKAAAPAASSDPLLTLLSQSTDLADLPIAVASYTTRGEEPASLKVLLSAEFGAAVTDWAFAVFDRGKVLADGRQQTAGDAGSRITTSLQLAPGRYRFRVAAMAGDGRSGVIDAPLLVGLRAAAPLQLSDVILGTALSGRIQPQSRIFAGQKLAALLEIVSADVAALEKTRIALEIIPAGAAEPVRRVLMAARGGASSLVLLAEAQIDTAALAPGRYTASAIALVDTQAVGRVSRTFEVVADPAK